MEAHDHQQVLDCLISLGFLTLVLYLIRDMDNRGKTVIVILIVVVCSYLSYTYDAETLILNLIHK